MFDHHDANGLPIDCVRAEQYQKQLLAFIEALKANRDRDIDNLIGENRDLRAAVARAEKDTTDARLQRPNVKAATPLETQHITATCRENRTFYGAWDDAVHLLRHVYEVQLARDPEATVSLAIYVALAADVPSAPELGVPAASDEGRNQEDPQANTRRTTDVPAASEGERPRIVCLCGSTRFPAAFDAANKAETLAGRIVVSIGCNLRTDADLAAQNVMGGGRIKQQLDELHKRKIGLADEILVLNVGGYIGDSTRSEIAHAERLGKPIRWLEPDMPAVSGPEVAS